MLRTSLFGVLSCALLEGGLSDYTSTSCEDAYECEKQTISRDFIYCHGYFSCQGSSMSGNTIYNYGHLSSSFSSLTSEENIAYGFQSLYGAQVTGEYVYGYGAYSLQYSDIEASSNKLYVYADGYYSAFYADISCKDGEECKIDCGHSYGCYGTKLYCYSGATCDVDCSKAEYCPVSYISIDATMKVNDVEIDVSNHEGLNAWEQKLPKGSKLGLTQQAMSEFYDSNSEIKKEKIANEENGLSDPTNVATVTIKLMKQNGDEDDITKDLLDAAQLERSYPSIAKSFAALKEHSNNNNNPFISMEPWQLVTIGAVVGVIFMFVLLKGIECAKSVRKGESISYAGYQSISTV